MTLQEYFENNRGIGILSTADSDGKVNAAVYARPHFMDDGSIAFIMTDRLTHSNLRSNPKAAYLFKEDGKGYKGRRLYCTKLREEENSDLIHSLSRKKYHTVLKSDEKTTRYLVYFRIDAVLPLIGDKE